MSWGSLGERFGGIVWVSGLNIFISQSLSSKVIEVWWFIMSCIGCSVLLFRIIALAYYGSSQSGSITLIQVWAVQWSWIYKGISINNGESLNVAISQDLELGDIRLLRSDTHISLFTSVIYDFLLSSGDVIHTFSLPSLGVKVDCIPGRFNEVRLICNLPGKGQEWGWVVS